MNLEAMRYRRAAVGHNPYCGPAALSILLHIDTAEAEGRLKAWRKHHYPWLYTGEEPVAGVAAWEMRDVLIDSGLQLRRQWDPAMTAQFKRTLLHRRFGPTLKEWMDGTKTQGVYLVFTTTHVQVMTLFSGLWLLQDNRTKDWVWAAQHPQVKRRARVEYAYLVEGTPRAPETFIA